MKGSRASGSSREARTQQGCERSKQRHGRLVEQGMTQRIELHSRARLAPGQRHGDRVDVGARGNARRSKTFPTPFGTWGQRADVAARWSRRVSSPRTGEGTRNQRFMWGGGARSRKDPRFLRRHLHAHATGGAPSAPGRTLVLTRTVPLDRAMRSAPKRPGPPRDLQQLSMSREEMGVRCNRPRTRSTSRSGRFLLCALRAGGALSPTAAINVHWARWARASPSTTGRGRRDGRGIRAAILCPTTRIAAARIVPT